MARALTSCSHAPCSHGVLLPVSSPRALAPSSLRATRRRKGLEALVVSMRKDQGEERKKAAEEQAAADIR